MIAKDLIDTPFIEVKMIGGLISPVQYIPFLECRLDLSSLQIVSDVEFEQENSEAYIRFSLSTLSDNPKANVHTYWYDMTTDCASGESIDKMKFFGRDIRLRNRGESRGEHVYYYLVDFYEAWLHNHIMDLSTVWIAYKMQEVTDVQVM